MAGGDATAGMAGLRLITPGAAGEGVCTGGGAAMGKEMALLTILNAFLTCSRSSSLLDPTVAAGYGPGSEPNDETAQASCQGRCGTVGRSGSGRARLGLLHAPEAQPLFPGQQIDGLGRSIPSSACRLETRRGSADDALGPRGLPEPRPARVPPTPDEARGLAEPERDLERGRRPGGGGVRRGPGVHPGAVPDRVRALRSEATVPAGRTPLLPASLRHPGALGGKEAGCCTSAPSTGRPRFASTDRRWARTGVATPPSASTSRRT